MKNSTPTTMLHLFLEGPCCWKPQGLAFPLHSHESLLGAPQGTGARARNTSFSRRTKKRGAWQPTPRGSFVSV